VTVPRRALAAGAVALAGGAVALVATGAFDGTGTSARARGAALPAGETTTTVQRRTLADQVTADGTLGYSDSRAIYNRLSGTYTQLPAVGSVVGRGHALFHVDGTPVVLMYGSLPAYRSLSTGASDGADVRELERNLKALGFDPGTVDEHYDAATAGAVRRWQHAEGLPETGTVELGRVVFAPGARRITAVKASVGSVAGGGAGTGGAGGSDGSASRAGSRTITPKATLAAYHPRASAAQDDTPTTPTPTSTTPTTPATTTPTTTTPTSTTPATTPKPTAPRRRVGSGSSGGGGSASSRRGASGSSGRGSAARSSSSQSSASGSGSGGGQATLVLQTTSTRQTVSLPLGADQQQDAYPGQLVAVQLPDGRVVHGRVSRVGRVASSSSSSGSDVGGGGGGGGSSTPTIHVGIRLSRPVARLDQAPVSVTLTKERRRNVLSVPATALLATAGGGYAVQVAEGGRLREVDVTPGLFANGYVEVSGPDLREGMTVTVPQ